MSIYPATGIWITKSVAGWRYYPKNLQSMKPDSYSKGIIDRNANNEEHIAPKIKSGGNYDACSI